MEINKKQYVVNPQKDFTRNRKVGYLKYTYEIKFKKASQVVQDHCRQTTDYKKFEDETGVDLKLNNEEEYLPHSNIPYKKFLAATKIFCFLNQAVYFHQRYI